MLKKEAVQRPIPRDGAHSPPRVTRCTLLSAHATNLLPLPPSFFIHSAR